MSCGANRKHSSFHNPYTNLAAAIIESGRQTNDDLFFKSDWYELLRDMCALDDEMYGGRTLGIENISGNRNYIKGNSDE